MKKIGLFLTFLIVIINNSYAQIELNPNSAHRLNVKAVGSGDWWGVFGTTSTANTNMVFRSGISNTNNWQNTGTIVGTLGYDGTNSMGLKLASFDRDLGLYGLEKIRFGTNAQSQRMIINQDGNVAINYNFPNSKLDVYGNGPTLNGAILGFNNTVWRVNSQANGNDFSTLTGGAVSIGLLGSSGNTEGSGAIANVGVVGTTNNNAVENIGVLGYQNANTNSLINIVGVKGQVNRTNFNVAMGVYGKVSGNSVNGGVGYGVYGEASGTGGTIYAGYFSGNVGTTGFTELGSGAPKIKVKKITGTTAATEGGYATPIVHGLNMDKILDIEVIIKPTSGYRLLRGWKASTGYEFDFYFDTTSVQVYNMTNNSSNILSKSFTVYITYEE